MSGSGAARAAGARALAAGAGAARTAGGAAPETPSDAVATRWEAVIGIEVHCQVRTVSKMFCTCAVAPVDAAPNTHVCPVCLALPGSLPTINRLAVEHVLRTGLAIEATAPATTRWDRKNYFYPDLPKGYQISQYDLPLASHGRLAFDASDGPVTVGITRAHLEEDTAKLIHAAGPDGRRVSLVDFNRAGVPLMEIVTDPDIRSAEHARRYAEELRLLLRSIGVSDAEMENGQMRVEANVSLRRRGTEPFGIRIEVKNMNSFRAVERAIEFEIDRQAAALDAGEPLRQETRGWDDAREATYVMRVKESSDDYRYFPEPDLPPLKLDPAWLGMLRASLPELPGARRARYRETLGLSVYDADVIVNDDGMTAAFEAIVAGGPDLPAKEVANLVAGDYGRAAKENRDRGPDGLVGRASAAELAALLRRILTGELSRANAREVLGDHLASGDPVRSIVERRGFRQISDASAVGTVVDEVLAANAAAVADYQAGKAQALGFLVGQVMKATRGQANAAVAGEAIRERLGRPGGPSAGGS